MAKTKAKKKKPAVRKPARKPKKAVRKTVKKAARKAAVRKSPAAKPSSSAPKPSKRSPGKLAPGSGYQPAANETFLGLVDDYFAHVEVIALYLKDIALSHDMERTIGKVAEAQRERQATIIASEGEVMASENMAKAAAMLAATPGALHLRTLQSINDMSSDQSNTVVYMIPVEVLKALEGFPKK
jgi:regulator of protease activity HflC (stomatin/prohibitin superfamily)